MKWINYKTVKSDELNLLFLTQQLPENLRITFEVGDRLYMASLETLITVIDQCYKEDNHSIDNLDFNLWCTDTDLPKPGPEKQ